MKRVIAGLVVVAIVAVAAFMLMRPGAEQKTAGTESGDAAAPAGISTFTTAQAERGALTFYAHCASCHGTELGGASAPPLSGPEMLSHWVGKSADDLYQKVRAMPPGSQSTLATQESADLVAFLLSRNGTRAAGTRELAPDVHSLQAIQVVSEAQAKQVAAMAPSHKLSLREDVTAAIAGGPTQAELSGANAKTADWLMQDHDYQGTRYVDLKQINKENVKNLKPICMYQPGDSYPFQVNPIVYRGIMFITTRGSVMAIDAANCGLKWRYDRVLRVSPKYPLMMHRGVAIKDGKVFYGTNDGYLIALDAGTGKLIWEVDAADVNYNGGAFTSVPTIFENMLMIGPASSELGVKGWFAAFDLETGKRIWKFNTIPDEGEPGAETWPNQAARDGGGSAVWGSRAVDVAAGRVYVPIANATPDFNANVRMGDNLYSASMVVLDVRTGKLLWHKQLTPHDLADYDLTHAHPLFTANVNGKSRNLVVAVGKEGVLHTFDRDTQELIYNVPVTTRSNNDVLVDEAARKGLRICPGFLGGVQWNGPAYSASTNALYVPSVDWCDISRDPPDTSRGWLTAIDASTGDVRWKYQSPRPLLAAVTATSADLLFTGELQGDMMALDAKSGEVLYRFATGGRMNGGVMTYVTGGKQLVAVASGNANSFWRADPGTSTIIIFGLP